MRHGWTPVDTAASTCGRRGDIGEGTGEGESIAVVDESVEDGVGERGIVEVGVPLVDRELTGDEGGLPVVAVVEDLEEVALGGVGLRCEPEVIKDDQVDLGEALRKLARLLRAWQRASSSIRRGKRKHRTVWSARQAASGIRFGTDPRLQMSRAELSRPTGVGKPPKIPRASFSMQSTDS